MKTTFAALTLAAGLAQAAAAVTFPSLTTIYVGSGVLDDGGADNTGEATSIHCSNVSGVTVQVRALVLNNSGLVSGNRSASLVHGATITFSTHATAVFNDTGMGSGNVFQGVVNVEATNSAVFCTAVVLDAGGNPPIFMSPLHLVRINGHPGAEE